VGGVLPFVTARRALGAGAVLLALALAGCADAQPGDTNNGPGYTENVSDLLVKIPALLGDPCRTGDVGANYPNCGRYVTEVANTANTLMVAAPSETPAANAIQKAVNSYQQLGCETVGPKPSAEQNTQCPQALRTIGSELDTVQKTLSSVASASATPTG
jgi:hypothetical protein